MVLLTATPLYLAKAIVRIALMSELAALFFALFGHVYFRITLTTRKVVAVSLINVLSTLFVQLALGRGVVATTIEAASALSMAIVLWRPMGFTARFWLYFFSCFLVIVFMEFVTNFLYMKIFPDWNYMLLLHGVEVYIGAPAPFSEIVLAMIETTLAGVILSIPSVIQHVRQARQSSGHSTVFQLRMAFTGLLLATIIVASCTVFNRIPFSFYDTGDANSLPPVMVFTLAGLLLLLFFWQIILQYRLYVDNQALQAKNRAYQSVLDGTREFRHNISNMIYGLEGVLLTGDMASIRTYYDDMTKRCLLTNNENVVALNRLADPVLTALLLRKLDAAAAKQLPVYMSADEGFAFDALPAPRLAEVLGVLLDNAVEAAEHSDGAQVNIVLRRTPAYAEILIANTYAESADLSFLTGEPVSAKPGHRATGLASAHRILQRFPEICFNQYLRGRFVETSLCRYAN